MSSPPLVPAFLAVGSNLEPEKHILAALAKLRGSLRVTAVSTFYRTAALARPAQPPLTLPSPTRGEGKQRPLPQETAKPHFLNGVVGMETDLPPRTLKLEVLRRVEEVLGRVRAGDRYASRTIDLDLVLYGNLVLAEPDLRLPDPGIRARNFLAVPLLELAPELVLPDTGERLAELAVAHDLSGMEARAEFTRTLRAAVMGYES
jgi:2-amino-4-hydroxy-6-hydroxymethyldihydropteridine diphosphokinase